MRRRTEESFVNCRKTKLVFFFGFTLTVLKQVNESERIQWTPFFDVFIQAVDVSPNHAHWKNEKYPRRGAKPASQHLGEGSARGGVFEGGEGLTLMHGD